ncbi:MAG: TrkH family potassium uptake protein [Acutalibacteraceae bacterium]|nr:TrkH family potassium uptake protein [Acutalibacteraceae bacterium]
MHYRSISFVLGCILTVEGIFLFLPTLVSVIYKETQVFSLLLSALICLAAGTILIFLRPKKLIFNAKEGFVTVSLGWILLSLFGCLPFLFSGEIPHFANAFFETVSGFTTTGASILSDVEAMSKGCLFWRSLTHWLGGMGVLVFLLAIIPMVSRGDSNGGHMHIMRAESPGPSVGKLVPKVKYTALILYGIYFALTVIEFIVLIIFKMPVFDAVVTAIGTAGTGGFGIKGDSMASYSPAIQWTVATFMIIFGINFNAFFFIIIGKFKSFFEMSEVRCYLCIVAAAVTIIMFNAYDKAISFFDNLRTVFFQVASLISSTGFATTDFNLWPSASKAILLCLMFVGACAGSTGGGMKVSRFIILFKSIKNQLVLFLHPGTVRKVKVDNKIVNHDVMRSVNVYFLTYAVLFAGSVFLISFDNYDFETNFTAVLTSLCNMGPGLSKVGPAENFGLYSDFSKYVLIFDMIAGRLELYPVLLLFYHRLWRGSISHKKIEKAV